MLSHRLVRTRGDRFRCTVCGLTWVTAPSSLCFGVPAYTWNTAPTRLKTAGALRKLGVEPEMPSGCIYEPQHPDPRFRFCWLYTVPESLRGRGVVARHQVRQRQGASLRGQDRCARCGLPDPRGLEAGLCDSCRFLNWLDFQHDEAVRWARGILAAPERYVILDTETTGLDPAAEIVQAGILALDGRALLDTLLKPEQPIPARATEIHGITDDMVASAPTFRELYDQIAALLVEQVVIIYNAEFDLRVLEQTAARHGLEPIPVPRWTCAMKWYAQYAGDWREARGGRPAGFRWKPLQGGDHSAIGDCRATLALIRVMAGTHLRSTDSSEAPV